MRILLNWSRHLLFVVVPVTVLWMPTRSEAQFRLGLGFGYGLGYGYGLGGFNYRPNQVSYINQKSLLNASKATMGPVPWNLYENDPGAYYKHLHDPIYTERTDSRTRREIEAKIGRFSDGPPPSRLARRDTNRGAVPGDHREPRDPLPAIRDTAETARPALARNLNQANPSLEPIVRASPQSGYGRGKANRPK